MRTPDASPQRFQSPAAEFVAAVIRGNLFYVASALFMMIGCYLLMKSPLVTGSEYARVLKSLLLLQGYEVVVIATAAFIMRRFRVLGDGFSLLLIALALLLDPTFFKNQFATMMRGGSVDVSLAMGTNAVCFALALAKVAALEGLLGLRFANATRAALVIAGALVYLAPGLLGDPESSPMAWRAILYAMLWGAVAASFAMPAAEGVFARKPPGLTPGQDAALPWLVALLPLAIVAAHHAETIVVFEVEAFAADWSPLPLMAAAVLLRNLGAENVAKNPIPTDFPFACALLMAFPGASRSALPLVPEWVPVAAAGTALVALYAVLWLRYRTRPLAWRLGLLAVGGAFFGLAKLGVFEAIGDFVRSFAVPLDMGETMLRMLALGVAGAFGWIAWRWRDWTLVPLAATAILAAAADLAPGISAVEVFWLLALSFWVLAEWKTTDENGGLRALFAIPAAVLPHFAEDAGGMVLMIACTAGGLAYTAWFRKSNASRLVLGMWMAYAAVRVYQWADIDIRPDPAVIVISIAAVLFAAGITVTLKRDQLLARLAATQPLAPPEEDLPRRTPPPRVGAPEPADDLARLLAPEPATQEPEHDFGARPPEPAHELLPEQAPPPQEPAPIQPPARDALTESAAAVRDTIARLIVADAKTGIMPREGLSSEQRERLRSDIPVPEGEADLLWILSAVGEGPGLRPLLAMTDRGVRVHRRVQGPTMMEFAQVAEIRRTHGTLFVVSHSGQAMPVAGLVPAQAEPLALLLHWLAAQHAAPARPPVA